jgi:hypothetical protein
MPLVLLLFAIRDLRFCRLMLSRTLVVCEKVVETTELFELLVDQPSVRK